LLMFGSPSWNSIISSFVFSHFSTCSWVKYRDNLSVLFSVFFIFIFLICDFFGVESVSVLRQEKRFENPATYFLRYGPPVEGGCIFNDNIV